LKLYYTDTDFLLIKIQTEDANADLIDMADQFDFSDYSKDHSVCEALGDKTDANMKIPGKFKDECNGAVIAEFIGLCPKMYSILKAEDDTTNPKHEIHKAKRVPTKIHNWLIICNCYKFNTKNFGRPYWISCASPTFII
jgi:hypothetical protein